jgi:hypothetical protein
MVEAKEPFRRFILLTFYVSAFAWIRGQRKRHLGYCAYRDLFNYFLLVCCVGCGITLRIGRSEGTLSSIYSAYLLCQCLCLDTWTKKETLGLLCLPRFVQLFPAGLLCWMWHYFFRTRRSERNPSLDLFCLPFDNWCQHSSHHQPGCIAIHRGANFVVML